MRDIHLAEQQPVGLVILDGWGYREDPTDNAIAAAHTPNFDHLWNTYPRALIEASGAAVGLPDGQMGNSEVGHTTIGAGCPIDTDLKRIGEAAKEDAFISNPVFRSALENVVDNNSTLHVLGLIGDGGVHAHGDYIHALLDAAQRMGVNNVALHAFTDGRDSGTQDSADHLESFEDHLYTFANGHVASVSGRYFAMDRDKNFDRQSKAEAVIFNGFGASSGVASQVLRSAYLQGQSDELFEPVAFTNNQGERTVIQPGDSVIFMNFRADRAIQLAERIAQIPGLRFVTLTDYGPSVNAEVAFPPVKIETTLAAEIDKAGFTQCHVAESEKGPHATYFLNGKRRPPHPNEKHEIVKSYGSDDGIEEHDQMPDMRAAEVAEFTLRSIREGTKFTFTNFANPDMVGHTANVPAIIKAIETTDQQLGLICAAMLASNGLLLVTADHGNAEVNRTPTGERHTAHTTNPVPLVAVSNLAGLRLRPEGELADLAPTILSLMGIAQPASMTGRNLII